MLARSSLKVLSGNTDPGFIFLPPRPLLSTPSPRILPTCPGKSVVSESEDEVQAAEVGRGGLRVAAEEEGIASHKPVETGDEAGEPGGNRRHLGRLNPPPATTTTTTTTTPDYLKRLV